MKKINILLLFAFIAIIAFQACKTKKKIIDKSVSNTINNDTIIKKQFLSDTTVYVYTQENIDKIRKEIPKDKEIMDIPNIYFLLENIYDLLYSSGGKEFANQYIGVYKKYGKKATDDEIKELKLKGKMPETSEEFEKKEKARRKKEKELFKKRLKTGERFSDGTSPTYSYEKIASVPAILKKTLPDVNFYYFHNHSYRRSMIALVYQGELMRYKHLNHLFHLNNPNGKNNLNDKIKSLIILYENDINAKVEILNVSEISVPWDYNPDYILNKKVTVKYNNIQRNYYLIVEDNQLLGIAKKISEDYMFPVSKLLKYIKYQFHEKNIFIFTVFKCRCIFI